MKKIIFTLSVLVATGLITLFSLTVKAQSFEVGTSAVNLGIGFGYSYGYGAYGSATPVIGGSYEYGALKLGPGTLGLGLQIAYQGASYSNGYYSETWTSTLFGVRGLYHPDFLQGDKYDVYGGIQLSYLHVGYSYSSNINNPYLNGLGGGFFYPYIIIGGRYYFTSNFGVFAELGYSLAYLNIGISLKFGGSGSGGGTGKAGNQ